VVLVYSVDVLVVFRDGYGLNEMPWSGAVGGGGGCCRSRIRLKIVDGWVSEEFSSRGTSISV
jgi:hypothetical protein